MFLFSRFLYKQPFSFRVTDRYNPLLLCRRIIIMTCVCVCVSIFTYQSCCTGGYRAVSTVSWSFSVVVILLVRVACNIRVSSQGQRWKNLTPGKGKMKGRYLFVNIRTTTSGAKEQLQIYVAKSVIKRGRRQSNFTSLTYC